MAKAVIDGRIDCKTAGRLVVQLQTVSKLLWMLHGKKTKTLPLINTDDSDLRKAKANLTAEARRRGEESNGEKKWPANEREETRIALMAQVRAVADRGGWAHAPPELLRAA